ncbi:predicted protein, partial [Nematostella vectensis]
YVAGITLKNKFQRRKIEKRSKEEAKKLADVGPKYTACTSPDGHDSTAFTLSKDHPDRGNSFMSLSDQQVRFWRERDLRLTTVQCRKLQLTASQQGLAKSSRLEGNTPWNLTIKPLAQVRKQSYRWAYVKPDSEASDAEFLEGLHRTQKNRSINSGRKPFPMSIIKTNDSHEEGGAWKPLKPTEGELTFMSRSTDGIPGKTLMMVAYEPEYCDLTNKCVASFGRKASFSLALSEDHKGEVAYVIRNFRGAVIRNTGDSSDGKQRRVEQVNPHVKVMDGSSVKAFSVNVGECNDSQTGSTNKSTLLTPRCTLGCDEKNKLYKFDFKEKPANSPGTLEYEAYKARKQLSAIDWNFHQGREKAVNNEGEQMVSRKYNRRTKEWNLRIIKVGKTYDYIPMLMAMILRKRFTDIDGITRHVSLAEDELSRFRPPSTENE